MWNNMYAAKTLLACVMQTLAKYKKRGQFVLDLLTSKVQIGKFVLEVIESLADSN